MNTSVIVANITKVNKAESTADHLQNLFQGLFPSWITILATLIALVILMLILTKLLFNPVKKMVDERKKFIQENIDSSIVQNNEATKIKELANNELLDAKSAATQIIDRAKLKAERIKEENLAKAKDEANIIINNAHQDMAREKIIFENDSRKEIVEVAMVAAKKILEKEVDNKENRKIIEEFINDHDKK